MYFVSFAVRFLMILRKSCFGKKHPAIGNRGYTNKTPSPKGRRCANANASCLMPLSSTGEPPHRSGSGGKPSPKFAWRETLLAEGNPPRSLLGGKPSWQLLSAPEVCLEGNPPGNFSPQPKFAWRETLLATSLRSTGLTACAGLR